MSAYERKTAHTPIPEAEWNGAKVKDDTFYVGNKSSRQFSHYKYRSQTRHQVLAAVASPLIRNFHKIFTLETIAKEAGVGEPEAKRHMEVLETMLEQEKAAAKIYEVHSRSIPEDAGVTIYPYAYYMGLRRVPDVGVFQW